MKTYDRNRELFQVTLRMCRTEYDLFVDEGSMRRSIKKFREVPSLADEARPGRTRTGRASDCIGVQRTCPNTYVNDLYIKRRVL